MRNLIDGLRILNSLQENLVVEAECGTILIEKPNLFNEDPSNWVIVIDQLTDLGFILKDDTFHYYT